MTLLSDATLAGIRTAMEITLVHTCTLQRYTTGVEDAEGNVPAVVSGSPITGARCRFEIIQRAIRDGAGVTLVSVPTLAVSASVTLSIGDQITAITDQLGSTPPGAEGTFRIERVTEDTAGLGAALLPSYELRAARTVA